jgi:hypothetical protein
MPSQYWFACFRDANGRQRRKSTKTPDQKKAIKPSGLIYPLSALISVSTAAICALTRALIGKGFGVSIV